MHDQEQSRLKSESDIIEDAGGVDGVPQPFWLKKIPIRNGRIGIRRNSKCFCGSGKKFKMCCLFRHKNGETTETVGTMKERSA